MIGVSTRCSSLVVRIERIRRRSWAYDPDVQAAIVAICSFDANSAAPATGSEKRRAATARTLRNRFKRSVGLNQTDLRSKIAVLRSLEILVEDPHINLEWLANRVNYTRLSSLVRAWQAEVGTTPGFAARVLRRGELNRKAQDRALEAAKLVDEARSRGGGDLLLQMHPSPAVQVKVSLAPKAA